MSFVENQALLIGRVKGDAVKNEDASSFFSQLRDRLELLLNIRNFVPLLLVKQARSFRQGCGISYERQVGGSDSKFAHQSIEEFPRRRIVFRRDHRVDCFAHFVAAIYDENHRQKIVAAAQEALEAISEARFATTRALLRQKPFPSSTPAVLSSKVAADMHLCAQYYGEPSEQSIREFAEELAQYLNAGYVAEYEFGYKKDGKRIVSWRYKVDENGVLTTDDRPGKVVP